MKTKVFLKLSGFIAYTYVKILYGIGNGDMENEQCKTKDKMKLWTRKDGKLENLNINSNEKKNKTNLTLIKLNDKKAKYERKFITQHNIF